MTKLDQTAVQLVRDMKSAISAADHQLKESGFTISQIQLELKTVIDQTAGGGINIIFLEIGGSYSKTDASTLSLTLAPSQAGMKLMSTPPEELVAAIVAVASASIEAAKSPPAFELTDARVTLGIGITTKGEFKLLAHGSGSREQGHTMTIMLTPTTTGSGIESS